jgi:hypothetical protein
MTAKEYLNSYREYAAIESQKLQAYQRAKDQVLSVRSSLGHLDEPHRQNRHTKEDQIIRLQTRREAWAIAALNALEVRQDVFSVICDIDGAAGDILYQRYLCLQTWDNVCSAVDLSLCQVHTIHKSALQIVQERINQRGL